MAEFGEFKFTNAGLALEAKVHTGKTLTFTKFVLGDGNYDGNIRNLTALVNPVMNQEVARLSIQNTTDTETGNLLKVVSCGFTINTLELETGFYLREIGLYARDPDTNEEVLYKYGNAGDTADYIAPGSSTTISEKAQNILMYFSDDADIHADVDPSTTYVTTSTFTNYQSEVSTALSGKEAVSNKVTSLSSDSTDTQYPSAKLLYNQLALKENSSNKVTSIDEFSTDTQYPSAKAVYDGIASAGSGIYSETITIAPNQWTLATSSDYSGKYTGKYVYQESYTGMTDLYLVNGYLDSTNKEKMADGFTETYTGYFVIVTSELPAESVTMSLTIQETKVVS